jgi:hypothetical protein
MTFPETQMEYVTTLIPIRFSISMLHHMIQHPLSVENADVSVWYSAVGILWLTASPRPALTAFRLKI